MNKYGFPGLNKNLNNNNNTLSKNLGEFSSQLENIILVGRVKSIILDNAHPFFEKLGSWNSIGTIEFIDTKIQSSDSSNIPSSFAKPFFPNIKNYPILNEIVYIISLPDENVTSNGLVKKNYYLNPINIWNHPHHNAVPFFVNTNQQNSQNKDYNQISLGNPNQVKNNPQEINLGEGFIERSNIHSLLSYLGDYIIEGRWGNSIRLGSTVNKNTNNWSKNGENGNPITIIRNGQSDNLSEEGWIPITENINGDKSSIYLTSNQKIPIEVSSTNYRSYNTIPILPQQYNNPQIILNSGRLLFNSNSDHILFSSKKSIGLSANESININSVKEFSIDSSKILLGNKNASESLLLGDKTVTLLDALLKSLDYLLIALEGSKDWPSGQSVPNSTIRNASTSTRNVIKSLGNQLNSLKSKVSKTI